MKNIKALTVILIMNSVLLTCASAQSISSEELQNRMVERRAVDAAIWGLPIISEDALRQAYFRDGKAYYGDIIWWPKGNNWMNQSLTPNTSVRYLYSFINTKESGPVVFSLPAAANGSRFLGTISDAWQVPLTDIGVEGRAETYLILPPGYTEDIPSGYIPVHPKTYNVFIAARSILASSSDKDMHIGDELVKKIEIHPLSKVKKPPVQRFVDMTGTLYSGLVKYDESLYISLARLLNEEPVQPKDRQMMGMLLQLGIKKGEKFNPDEKTIQQLRSAAIETEQWLLAQLPGFTTDWWANSQWKIPINSIAPETGFKWEVPDYFDIDGRGIAFSTFFVPPAKLGAGSFYLGTFFDGNGQLLNGSNNYHLHVPKNVPVSQFWSLTVYNSKTSGLFLNMNRPSLDSFTENLQVNSDGSVDLYMGHAAPSGMESNLIKIPNGKGWFPWFRFYGPEQSLFNKSWKMPDIEKVN